VNLQLIHWLTHKYLTNIENVLTRQISIQSAKAAAMVTFAEYLIKSQTLSQCFLVRWKPYPVPTTAQKAITPSIIVTDIVVTPLVDEYQK
jgi:hypothetical protein